MQPEDGPVSNEDEDEESEEEQTLPECVVRRLDRLQELEKERANHMEQYLKERAALEAKYNSMNSKLYEERSKIVTGEQDTASEEEPAGVPQFWLNCMSNNEEISATISEDDVDCLVFLKDISCMDDEDGQAFTLKFSFDANPFFDNDVLTKRYEVPNLLSGSEPILKKVTGKRRGQYVRLL